MAIDRWLLDQAVHGDPRLVLRFYRWSRPTLSLGHHQGDPDQRWHALMSCGAIDLVRRPSGGGAVLHAGDLTYALIWPQAPSSRHQAYSAACRWLIEGFASLDRPLRFGCDPAGRPSQNCFSSSTAADLVEAGGGKRVGSAQVWRRGCLLQHGSILITPPEQLWRAVFGTPPPRLDPLPEAVHHWRDLAAHLARVSLQSLPGALEAPLEPMVLSPADWEQIRRLRQGP